MDGDIKPIYGLLQYPHMDYPFTDNFAMKITDHISANLNAWMSASRKYNTDKKLSSQAGVGSGTVQRIRRGEGNPTITSLCAIAHAFNRRVEDLLAAPEGTENGIDNVVRFSVCEPTPQTYLPVMREICDLIESMEERGQWELVGEARMLARLYPKQKNTTAPK